MLAACVALAIGWAARTGETPDHPAALEAGNPTNAPLGSISEPRCVGEIEDCYTADPWFERKRLNFYEAIYPVKNWCVPIDLMPWLPILCLDSEPPGQRHR